MRYFIAFIVALGLIFVLVFLLFRGGGDKQPLAAKPLESLATTSAEVKMTIDGPINAASQHEQVRITASKNNVTFEEIKGYDGEVVKMQNFSNTTNAYENFLAALGRAGFRLGDKDPALRSDLGHCPLGNRYIFQLTDGNQDISRYWATSCGKPKSYLGNLNVTISLFQAQIPEYNELVENLNL